MFLKIISRIATELAEVSNQHEGVIQKYKDEGHLPCILFHAAPHNHDLIRPLLHFLSFLNHKMLGNWRGPWVFIIGLGELMLNRPLWKGICTTFIGDGKVAVVHC